MKKKWILFFMFFLFNSKSPGCGWESDIDITNRAYFFNPELIEDKTMFPFLLNPYEQFYNSCEDSKSSKISPLDFNNLKEWSSFYKEKLSTVQINQLVFQSSINEIDQLIFYVQGKEKNTSEKIKDLALALKNIPDKELIVKSLYYLGFAKRVEPLALVGLKNSEWETDSPRNEDLDNSTKVPSTDWQKQLQGGLNLLKMVKNSFLETRYHFQILRIYFYSQKYSELIEYFEKNNSLIAKTSSIYYRSLGLAAGALYRTKNYSKANYFYAQIFDQYPLMRNEAFLWFHPQRESDWNQSLALAKNKQEQSVLWLLLGIYFDPLRAIQKIYDLDPKSHFLALLLVRQINKIESLDKIDISTFDLIKKIADSQKAEKSHLWLLATAHLYAINNDIKESNKYLALATKVATHLNNNKINIENQIRMTQILANLNQVQLPQFKMTKALENYFISSMIWLEGKSNLAKPNKNCPQIVMSSKKMMNKIRETLKIYYVNHKNNLLGQILVANSHYYNSNSNIDELMEFNSSKNKSELENYFYKKTLLPSSDDLLEFKAINYLKEGNLKDASETYILTKNKFKKLLTDPFLIHNIDCHDCDLEKKYSGPLSRGSFVEKLYRLEVKTKNSSATARDYFDLASGLYNLTYFGNSRSFYEGNGGQSAPGSSYFHKELTLNPSELTLINRAEKNYQKAFELQTSKEAKARAAFMIAKCEQAKYQPEETSTAERKSYQKNYTADFISGFGFRTLREKFSDTAFFKEIIQECGYFKTYMSKNILNK